MAPHGPSTPMHDGQACCALTRCSGRRDPAELREAVSLPQGTAVR
jgi:hypothetical protein